MSGLYQKALSLSEKLRQSRLTTPESTAAGPGGVSEEERQKILSRLDGILSENRIEISPETLTYTPKRSGALLPVLTNLSIFFVVAVLALGISALLNRQEKDIASGRTIVQGAENQLIQALKEDSARRLQQKDRVILDAQAKLAQLGAQAEKLKNDTDARVKARTADLQSQFDEKLQTEKDRLQKQGLTAAVENERLREFEAAQRQTLGQQLVALRRQAEADLAAQQKSLAGLTTEYQKQLDAARQERVSAQEDFASKQEALRRQYAQSEAAAKGETARVNEELARLQADRQKEQLFLDQIYAGYDRVNQALQASDYTGALSNLSSIRQYFDSPDVASLPTIQKRRPVELFLVSSLEELIRNRMSSTSADAATIVQQSADLRAVSDLVARGDTLSRSGDLEGARQAYLAAIRQIPLVSHGYEQLQRIAPAEVPAPALISGLRQANVFYQAGNLAGSVDQYRQAVKLIVKDDALAKQVTDNVMNAGYHLLAADDLAALSQLRGSEERRQAVLARLQEIRTEYLAYERMAPQFSTTAPPGDQSLASLLQAKILLLQIVDTEPVRSEYPGLRAGLQRFFDALEQQGRQEGRQAAMDDVDALLGKLAPGTDASVSSTPGGTADPLAAVMDRLEAVLAGN